MYPDVMPEGAYCVHMRQGFCVSKPFDPIFSTRCPLPDAEFRAVFEELNHAVTSVFPAWLSALPFVMLFTGFILFGIGGFTAVSSEGPPVMVFFGMGLFLGGMVSMICVRGIGGNRALDSLRRKLSELNAKYHSQGLDFDLHESRHLQMYHRHNSDGFNSRGVRSVTTYTLVIQNLLQLGDQRIPNAQAMQQNRPNAPPNGAQAPLMQPGYQQFQQQQPHMALPHVAVAQAVTMMNVECPPNTSPGSIVQIQAPDGRLMNVEVPQGIMPGQQFQVQL